jgi:hypothetical protein
MTGPSTTIPATASELSSTTPAPYPGLVRKSTREAVTPGVFGRAGLWAALAFALNLAWEIAQVRLYSLWAAADHLSVAWSLLHCTLGDVLIALAIYLLAGAVLWRPDWPASQPWAGSAIAVAGALAYTAWSEWYNVYRAGRWAYTASMPLIFGIGLSPLLQWLILPPILVLAYRRLGPMLFGRHNSDSPLPTHDGTRNPT